MKSIQGDRRTGASPTRRACAETLEGRRLLAGVGVVGDSYADEYQFYPPDRSTAMNFVELLAAHRGFDFGAFSTVSRGAPRDQGVTASIQSCAPSFMGIGGSLSPMSPD